MLSVRIVCADFYMSTPFNNYDPLYSEFRSSVVNQVPIIRIFGASKEGVKTCLHVHGVFPYIYIPYDGSEPVETLMYQIANNLDKAINISLNRGSSNTQHIFAIKHVSGIPMYGYHHKEHQFLKLYFYNPLIMKKASNLLQEGHIMGKIFQPFEAHLPYVLQFMIDYNLHGMSFISVTKVSFRQENDKNMGKVSVCTQEGDVLADDILNKLDIDSLAANPGILAIWEDEKQRRRNNGDLSQISQCLSLDKKDIEPTTTHKAMKILLMDRLATKKFSEQNDVNTSVYPAETLEELLDASIVDSHSLTQCSSEFSNITCLQDTNETIIDENEKELYDILKDLKDDKEVETDCILSQVIHENEELEENDEEVDMTLPLEDFQTMFEQDMCIEEEAKQKRPIDKIVSYDGPCDSSSDEEIPSTPKNRYSQLAIVVQSPSKKLMSPRQTRKRRASNKLSSTVVQEQTVCRLKGLGEKLASSIDVAIETKLQNVHKDINNENPSTSTTNIVNSKKTSLEKEITDAKKNIVNENQSTLNDKDNIIINVQDTIQEKPDKVSVIELENQNLVEHNNLLDNDQRKEIEHNADVANIVESDLVEKIKENTLCGDKDIIMSVENTINETPSLEINDCKNETNIAQECDNKNKIDQSTIIENTNITSSKDVLLIPKFTNIIMSVENTLNETPNSEINDSKNETIIALECDKKNKIDQSTIIENTNITSSKDVLLIPKFAAPTKDEIKQSLSEYSICEIKYQQPFCSDYKDVTGNVEIGTDVLNIQSKSVKDCVDFDSSFFGINDYRRKSVEIVTIPTKNLMNAIVMSYCNSNQCLITPVNLPPTNKIVNEFLTSKKIIKPKIETTKIIMSFSPGNESVCEDLPLVNKFECEREVVMDNSYCDTGPSTTISSDYSKSEDVQYENSCNITGGPVNNTINFQLSLENLQNVKSIHEHQYLTVILMEVHCYTRGNLNPDPTIDPIKAIFYLILQDAPGVEPIEGVIAVGSNCNNNNLNVKNVLFVDTELMLFQQFTNLFDQYNPDICIGYEIEMQSWGYFVDRGYILELNLVDRFSRIITKQIKYSDDDNNDLKFIGRILLNLWRLMRHEIALQSYTFESIVFHILHERSPLYSFKTLNFWWEHASKLFQYKVVDYYMYRLKSMSKLIDQLDLIGRTSELARLFGIQFYEVLSRGSQFRVESMMLRSAKPLNFIAVSPSIQQRAKMKAPEFLPLILEPESKFYTDPIIVLDFQSLYPSMIIAYNYCFSTCLGRIEHLGRKSAFEFGAGQLKVNPRLVEKFMKQDKLNFSPCGVAFVKEDVRKGVLPRMLQEILGTRLMVKKSMKLYKGNKSLQRVLHSRQLGLKLIANVTYGYTAANFSGRMPLVELGDSVVSKGRETLYRAIKMVEANNEWGAKVVYGDTDSLFVMIPGRSKAEAFRIGQEIADAVTNDNPSPVKLKLEKVYLPSILQTKKRYVGYMYETPDQVEPIFEAKGIETVRRDGCPAVSKMLEKTLRILFETRDVSKVRKYVDRQLNKVITGRISVQDLTFAKEYRGQRGYRPGACVPALELARKWTSSDKRSEPRSGERVPYVIVNGPPGLPLIRLVRSPRELLGDSSLRLNSIYYITKVIIPPINRCFSLIGADLNNWFKDLPRKHISYLPASTLNKKSTISQYFCTVKCAVCGEQTKDGVCKSCIENSQASLVILHDKVFNLEKAYFDTRLICKSCSGNTNCISLDCPVLYRLEQTKRDMEQVPFVSELIMQNF